MRLDVISIFPELIEATTRFGVVGRAKERRLLEVVTWNPRAFATDKHQRVDERPFGGGPGMVMSVEPLHAAISHVRQQSADPGLLIHLSPQGERLTQGRVESLSRLPRLILLCGRYEAIDERLLAAHVDLELSIGDYVLSGGELAAGVLIDALGRLQEGALGNADSAAQDSFSHGLLDCPHYSRPEVFAGQSVPAVLLSGDHGAIARWRLKQRLGRTWLRRPDLLAGKRLSAQERALLEEFVREYPDKAH